MNTAAYWWYTVVVLTCHLPTLTLPLLTRVITCQLPVLTRVFRFLHCYCNTCVILPGLLELLTCVFSARLCLVCWITVLTPDNRGQLHISSLYIVFAQDISELEQVEHRWRLVFKLSSSWVWQHLWIPMQGMVRVWFFGTNLVSVLVQKSCHQCLQSGMLC